MANLFLNPHFTIFGLDIYYYGVIIVGGMAVALLMLYFMFKKFGIPTDAVFNYALIVIPFAVLCARLYFFIFPYTAAGSDWSRFFNFRDGGLAIYGGLIGGAIAFFLGAKLQKHEMLKVADLAIPGVAAAQAIGRWGNFVNGEAHGAAILDKAWQWFPAGVNVNGVWYQATFFYESLWNIIGVAIMLVLIFKCYRKGMILGTYCIWYGIGRLWIEALRTDSLYLIIGGTNTGIKISQLVSVIILILGAILYCYAFRKELKKLYCKLMKKAYMGPAAQPESSVAGNATTGAVGITADDKKTVEFIEKMMAAADKSDEVTADNGTGVNETAKEESSKASEKSANAEAGAAGSGNSVEKEAANDAPATGTVVTVKKTTASKNPAGAKKATSAGKDMTNAPKTAKEKPDGTADETAKSSTKINAASKPTKTNVKTSAAEVAGNVKKTTTASKSSAGVKKTAKEKSVETEKTVNTKTKVSAVEADDTVKD